MDPNSAEESLGSSSDSAVPGAPLIVDMRTWREASAAVLAREKALTRESDAIAAARRRLPMVEIDGSVQVHGPDGPVPFSSLFDGREELIVYQHMWYDEAPHQGQCEGCTTMAWQLDDSVYLGARGVSFAIVTVGSGPRSNPSSASWATAHPGTPCAGSMRRSAARWGTSCASSVAMTVSSSPTRRRAGGSSG